MQKCPHFQSNFCKTVTFFKHVIKAPDTSWRLMNATVFAPTKDDFSKELGRLDRPDSLSLSPTREMMKSLFRFNIQLLRIPNNGHRNAKTAIKIFAIRLYQPWGTRLLQIERPHVSWLRTTTLKVPNQVFLVILGFLKTGLSLTKAPRLFE